MTAPTPPELKDAAKLVPTVVNMWDLAIVSDTLSFDLDAIEETAAAIIENIDRIKELTTIRSKTIVPEGPVLLKMMVDGIAKIAAPLCGGQVFAPDTFKKAVEAAVDPEYQEFCMRQSWQAMIGLLREHPEIAELLKADGILIWLAGEFDPADDLIRLVNTRWLRDESDIYFHVVNEPKSGKFCRYCLAVEPAESLELQPLNPADRSKDAMVAGMAGERIQILQPCTVYCHVPCSPYWIEWVRIAEALEEAAA